MGIGTLIRYLLGGREAILAIAGNRHALWIGLLFVLSAGFAREYDGEDLLHEPWHLLIPVAASLAASFGLFLVVRGFTDDPTECEKLPFFKTYASFLGLFWMPAPLAWLYAVPYERFLSANDAIDANLITLGVVALWRVALMARVLSVCARLHPIAAFGLVVMFGAALVFLFVAVLQVQLIGIMGGIRPNPTPTRLQSLVRGMGCLPLVVGFAAMVVAAVWRGKRRQVWDVGVSLPPPYPSRGLRILALSSLLIWAFLLPFTQPEQQRRYLVERAYRQGRADLVLDELSAHPREDYPPHWGPPPTSFKPAGIHRQADFVVQILEESSQRPVTPWVVEYYLDRLEVLLEVWRLVGEERIYRLAAVLPKLPGGLELIEQPLPEKSDPRDFKRENLEHLKPVHEILQREAAEAAKAKPESR